MLDLPISRVHEAMAIYLGSAFVNDFNILGRTYRVTAQAEEGQRLTPRDVAALRTRNDAGEMVPVGSLASFRDAEGLTPEAAVELAEGVGEQASTAKPGGWLPDLAVSVIL